MAYGHHANYKIVQNSPCLGGPVAHSQPTAVLVIKDITPWDQHPTVTNDAEWVVENLYSRGLLLGSKLLLYYDSEGHLDQLLHDGQGHFTGFAPGPRGITP